MDEQVRNRWFEAVGRGDAEVLASMLRAFPELLGATRFSPLRETALHIAAEYGHFQAVKLLVDEGADVNAMTKCDDTPLDFARFANDPAVLSYLVEHGGEEHN